MEELKKKIAQILHDNHYRGDHIGVEVDKIMKAIEETRAVSVERNKSRAVDHPNA